MTNGILSRIVAIFLALLLTGCASTGQLVQRPTVQLSGVEVTKLSFAGQTCRLSFDVNNPNPFPLPINSVRYHIQLSEQRFASGEAVSDFSIPANGDGQFDISVELDILKTASTLTTVLRSGMREPVPYELSGSFSLNIPLVKPIPFSTTGMINIASR